MNSPDYFNVYTRRYQYSRNGIIQHQIARYDSVNNIFVDMIDLGNGKYEIATMFKPQTGHKYFVMV